MAVARSHHSICTMKSMADHHFPHQKHLQKFFLVLIENDAVQSAWSGNGHLISEPGLYLNVQI